MKYIDGLSSLKRFFHSKGYRQEHRFPHKNDENHNICEIQYCRYRSIAVELNNISVDFYSHGKYVTAMEFCCDASNVLLFCTNSGINSMCSNFDDDCKEVLSSKIKDAKEQLQTMGQAETRKLSILGSSDEFLCFLNAIRLDLHSSSSLKYDSAAVLYNIGLIHMRTGTIKCAKQMFEFALSMDFTYESFPRNYVHLFLAASNNLSCILQTQRDNQQAVNLLIALSGYVCGKVTIPKEESRLLFAVILCNIGTIEVAKENYEKAMELLNTSLDVMRKAVEENDPDTACILLKIGKIQFELGKTSASITSFLDVIRIQRKAFGNDHYLVAEPMYQLGIIFESLGEYENALNAYEQTAQIEINTLGANHSQLVATLCSIGRVHYEQGDLDLALLAHEKVKVIMEANSDIDHISVAFNLVAMGKIYRDKGMINESQVTLSSSKEILLQVEPDKRGIKADILIGLIDCDLAHPLAAATA